MGFEPTACSLRKSYSTTELRWQIAVALLHPAYPRRGKLSYIGISFLSSVDYFIPKSNMEQVTGIEPVSRPWEGRILPLNHTCASIIQRKLS